MLQIFRFHTFISYRSLDGPAALELTKRLQTEGLRPWLDRDGGESDRAPRHTEDSRGQLIPGGELAVEEVLEQAVKASMLTLVITSSHTLSSVWVRREVEISARHEKPLFFWHLSELGNSRRLQMRRDGGAPPATRSVEEYLEAIKSYYREEPMATSDSTDLMLQLSTRRHLNVVGHLAAPPSHAPNITNQLKQVIEMGELVVHHGQYINTQTLQEVWPEYELLCSESQELTKEIHRKYNRWINVDRVPAFGAFRLKRPFVVGRIAHLKRLLADDEFRSNEFDRLGRM